MSLIKKIIIKYNIMSPALKAIFWFTICNCLQKCISIIMTPFFTRIMSPLEFGEFSIYTSWLNILTVIITLNINSIVVNKGLIKFPGDQDGFAKTALIISSISVICFAIIYFGFNKYINKIVKFPNEILIVMMLNIFFLPAYEIWMAKEKFFYRYKKIVVFTLAYCLVYCIITISSVFFAQNKGSARIFSSSIIQIIFYAMLYYTLIKASKKQWNNNYAKFIVKFNMPLIPQGLSNQILARSDIFMINYYIGAADTGIYSLGYTFAMMLTVLTSGINSVFVPWLFKNIEEKKYKENKIKTNLLIEIILIIIIFIILITPEMICVFAGKIFIIQYLLSHLC